ncbi:hypothetical protein ABW20_dc0109914 [Dactylellina cionopaga]|nr:hypothetical protein ABW20_dc0109914 [Dactylellina cionopaga]
MQQVLGIVCSAGNSVCTIVGDKLFLAGGFRVLQDPSTGAVHEEATNDFQYLDLGPEGTSFQLGSGNKDKGTPWQAINYTVNGAAGLPKVANGAMFRNGDDLYIYEGRLPGLGREASSSLWKYTAETSVWGQEIAWMHSDTKVPNRVSRGGSLAVGDQGIGVYLGGARIFINDTISPKTGSWVYPSEEQLTTFDLRNLNRTTTPLPDFQKRMGAALGYLPIGTKGAMIGIGGTLENEGIRESGEVSDISKETFDPDDINFSPMQRVWIMDLDTRKWYSQSTFGTYIPDSRMEHCIAVASAPDNSSHNIYMFGGSTASSFLNRKAEEYHDELYILSIPSFRWIRRTFDASENSPVARIQHTCHVHGKNLVILGGATQNTTDQCSYDEVNILDMASLKWVTNYQYSADQYTVPEIVMGSISNNGEVQTAPVNGWDDHHLEELFYANSDYHGGNSNTMVRIAAIAGGVAGGVILLLIIAAGLWHWRKKRRQELNQKRLKSKVAYESSRYDHGYDPTRDGGAVELHSSPSSVNTNTFDQNSGYAHPGKLWRNSYHSYEVSEADVDYRDDDEAKLIGKGNVPSGYFELGNPSSPTRGERHELGGDLSENRFHDEDHEIEPPVSARSSRWR